VLVTLEHEFKPEIEGSGDEGEFLGFHTSIDEDSLFIGSPKEDSVVGIESGSVYVYERVDESWILSQKLTAPDEEKGAGFGTSVSVKGDTAIVGAHLRDAPSREDSGAAYIFKRNAGIWEFEQQLTAADAFRGDYFGSSVSISGDYALIGAPNKALNSASYAGSAYLFRKTSTGWEQEVKLAGTDSTSRDYFGSSVSLWGDTAVIGAPYHDSPVSNAGAVYVFERNGITWTQVQKLTASDVSNFAQFGTSLHLSENSLIVGAPETSVADLNSSGRAYIFEKVGSIFSDEQIIDIPAGANATPRFGYSVALNGDRVVIGNSTRASMNENGGTAFVYRRENSIWNFETMLTGLERLTESGATFRHFLLQTASQPYFSESR
jgi:hypothetical protein